MAAILVGVLTVALGVAGILRWPSDCLILLKGLLPVSFIGGGIIAILAGISSLRK